MRNLSIGTRILLSIGSLAVGYLLFLTLVQWTGSAMVKHMKVAADDLFPAALATQDAHEAFQKMNRAYADAVLMQDPKSLDTAAKEGDKVHALLQTIEAKTAALPELKRQIEPLIAQFSATDAKSRGFYKKILSGQVDLEAAATNRSIVLDNQALDKMFGEFNDTISNKSVQTELSAVSVTIQRQRLLTAALFLFAAVFAAYTTRSLRLQISVPVQRTVSVLERLAEGDLTVSLKFRSGDEMQTMADAFNVAMERMRGMIVQAGESARRASASSAQLAQAAGTIAEGTQHQAANLQQTTASLDELASTVKQNAEDAGRARALATSAGATQPGARAVANAVDAMAEIEKASGRIAGIIQTIEEIAFQTNLLAVNAAVEAAHAGQEGLGFAVVAQEVRRLSQRTAQAANEVTVLIQESLGKVATGTHLVRQVTDLVTRIASASAQQTVGLGEVNAAMTGLDRVARSNTVQTDQLSATAQELSLQSSQLLELIGTFHVGGVGLRVARAA